MAVSYCDVHLNNHQKETNQHGDIFFPIACYEDDMAQLDVPIHWHGELEYIYVTQGIVKLHVGTKPITLKQGDAILINANILHAVEHRENEISVLKSLVFHPDVIAGNAYSCFYQELIAPIYGQKNLPYFIMDGKREWHHVFAKRMMQAWKMICDEEEEEYTIEARYQLSKAFKLLTLHLNELPIEMHQDHYVQERVRILLGYIEEHYQDNITNTTLANLVACSESVLLRNFKSTVGTSPMHYLLNYRIQQAAKLLLETDMKSTTIALTVGFNDISYFTKMFRKIVGTTPLQFRKANKG